VIAPLLAFGLPAFTVSLGLTLLAERVAPRLGVVARPAADRWHRAPIPLLGGVAIAATTVAGVVATSGGDHALIVLALAGLAMAAVGLIDDVRPLSPGLKLLGEMVIAAAVLWLGLALHLTGVVVLDALITLVWIVGITNAFNLLDNMDGLAAAIAIVTAGFRLWLFARDGDAGGAGTAVVFLGALTGFLVRNFPPARIFMGDAGSLFTGFFLAALPLTAADPPDPRGGLAAFVVPVLLVSVPLFDTAFVTTTRAVAGRSIVVGGRDHTSHRLVAIGWTERQTVLLLAALSVVAGAIAVLSYRLAVLHVIALLALLVAGLVALGVVLSRVRTVPSWTDAIEP
jgi:UDP-GlcNAc:undecaprenyl-phosphate GlcNAc-1-phosphate transferase